MTKYCWARHPNGQIAIFASATGSEFQEVWVAPQNMNVEERVALAQGLVNQMGVVPPPPPECAVQLMSKHEFQVFYDGGSITRENLAAGAGLSWAL